MRKLLAGRSRAILTAAAVLLWACAPKPKPSVVDEPSRISLDRSIAHMLATGKFDTAQKIVDSLAGGREPVDREVAAYWKSICWMYRDEPDSALVILEAYHGRWSGGLRRVHSEVFLRLAREVSQARALARQHHEDASKPAPDKTLQERVDGLQQETVELRAEIAQLETERLKYQKLIKDLETIR